MPFRLQAVTLRITAISRVECAEEIGPAKAGGNLVAGIPLAVIATRGTLKPLRLIPLAVS